MATSKLKVRVAAETVAVSRPDQMYGWPGLVRQADGTLVAAVSERKHHVCPHGRIVIVRSTDNGKKWGLPQEVFNSEMDDRHPSLAVLPDGTLICSLLTVNFWMSERQLKDEWKARAARVSEKMLEESLGDWLVRSFDGGKTWEQVPHRMPNGGSLHASPYAMSDGALACFGYELVDGAMRMFFYTSKDKGETWSKTGDMPRDEVVTGTFAWAPWRLAHGKEVTTTPLSMRTMAETAPGHLVALFGGAEGFLYQSTSDDAGKTWSAVGKTPVWGFPAHLLRLESGVLLCTYGHRKEPWGVRGVLSYDGGKTWDTDNLITIAHWTDNPDSGYPVAVETAPGEVTVVYYCHREGEARENAAGESGLLARRLTLR